MAKLELNVDGYGWEGQLSLLADYVEFCAHVRAQPVRHKQIGDYLEERRLEVRGFRRSEVAVGDADATPDAEDGSHLSREGRRRQRALEDAARIGQLLAQRQHRLGIAYPFLVSTSGTSFEVRRRARRTTAYDVALAISLGHACAADASVPAQFEAFTADCFRARGYRTFAVGEHRRDQSGAGIDAFRAVHAKLVKALGLRVGASAELSPHVHDAGADVLARAEPVDDRAGCRTLLVQATVGKAETWHHKLHEVRTRTWADLLGDPIAPLVTLAIPHHIEDAHLRELVENGLGGTVADRLRLVAHGPTLGPAHKRLVERLVDGGVEW